MIEGLLGLKIEKPAVDPDVGEVTDPAWKIDFRMRRNDAREVW